MIPRLTDTPMPAPLYGEFLTELRARGFEGDLSPAYADRTVLATDNSIYQLTPQAVAFPRNADDLVRIARLMGIPFRRRDDRPAGWRHGHQRPVADRRARRRRLPAYERDPGDQCRGALGRVQPGVVKDQLNAALAEHGLFFPPELSTSNRATIGGMISTDASGQGSCLYGKTRDHVLELTTVLLDGSLWRSFPLEAGELAETQRRGRPRRCRAPPGRCHPPRQRGADRAPVSEAQPLPDRLRSRAYPRRAGPLRPQFDPLRRRGHVGTDRRGEAERSAHPRLQRARQRALRKLRRRAARRPGAGRVRPGLDRDRRQQDPVAGPWRYHLGRRGISSRTTRLPGAGSINLVEFVGDTEQAVEAAAQRLTDALRSDGSGGRRGFTVARGETDVGRIWEMRKKAVGLLGNMQGDKRPIPFVEDTAVPPENLADYIAEFRTPWTGAGWSTACSVTSMPVSCTSDRRST